MAPDHRLLRRRQRGLSYVEVLIAVVIVAVCLAPALDALRGGIRAAAIQGSQAVNQQRLKTRMEEVLANRFVTLDAAALAAGNSPGASLAACSGATVVLCSDAPGTADRLLVTLYRYDSSAATATVNDTGLLWVNVAIAGSNLSLDTLRSRW